MAKTVFFSWQSDTPNGIGRSFLRKVLDNVCAEIAAEASVEEAFRNELKVDSDTQDVAGQPPIAETILKKIDAAAIFVADVTFTGKRDNGRPTPNPNVLIEYGWALKSLGYNRVISIMNEAYGKASTEDLPFDLAHLRWPMRYSLPENASSQQKEEAKRQLSAALKTAIRACLVTIPSFSAPPSPPLPSEDERRRRIKDVLGAAHRCGEKLLKVDCTKIVEQEWCKVTRQLILEAFGDGEASLFESGTGYTGMYIGKSKAIQIGVRRLAELIRSCDRLEVRDIDLTAEKEATLRDQYTAFEHC
jgi:hypothetical protein